jgi:hypothetical protein
MEYILDQQNVNAFSGNYNPKYSEGQERHGESFIPSVTAPLTRISLNLSKLGSPAGNLWITLEADSGGFPSGIPLDISENINISSLPTSPTYAYINFDFLGGYQLQSGTSYWFVLHGDQPYGNDINQVKDGVSDIGSYTTGLFKIYDSGVDSWSGDQGYDLQFKEYHDTLSDIKKISNIPRTNIKKITEIPISNVKKVGGIR